MTSFSLIHFIKKLLNQTFSHKMVFSGILRKILIATSWLMYQFVTQMIFHHLPKFIGAQNNNWNGESLFQSFILLLILLDLQPKVSLQFNIPALNINNNSAFKDTSTDHIPRLNNLTQNIMVNGYIDSAQHSASCEQKDTTVKALNLMAQGSPIGKWAYSSG